MRSSQDPAFIWIGLLRLSDRQRHHECRTFTWSANGRDGAAVPFDDLAADRQPDPRSLVLGAPVKSLKNREYLLRVHLFKTDPIVFDQDLTIRPRGPAPRWHAASVR